MLKRNQKCHSEMLHPLAQVPLLRCPPRPAAPIPGCSSSGWLRCVCTHQHPSRLTLTTAFEEDISMLHFPSNFVSSALHTIQAWPEEKNNNPKTVRPLCATPLMLRSCIGQEDDPGWCIAPRLQLQSLQEQKAMVSSLHLRTWESGPFPVVYASYLAVLLGALKGNVAAQQVKIPPSPKNPTITCNLCPWRFPGPYSRVTWNDPRTDLASSRRLELRATWIIIWP